MSVQIESDLKEFFNKFEKRFDKIDEKLENIGSEITELKVGQAELTGAIETLDQKLTGKIETLDQKLTGKIDVNQTAIAGLDKRIGNVEFANRGIFIALIITILGGFLMFAWMFAKFK